VVQHIQVSEGGQAVIAGSMKAGEGSNGAAEADLKKSGKHPMNRDANGCETAIHRATSSGRPGAGRRLGVERYDSVVFCRMDGVDFTAG
jgi:hypothetical protein